MTRRKASRGPKKPKYSGYWIYPGERRPVVVKALTEKEAEIKVRRSRDYDGFGVRVFRVEEYATKCRPMECNNEGNVPSPDGSQASDSTPGA